MFREQLRFRPYARRTEETYVGWTRDFIRFHRGRHPREMGGSDVRAYLTYLSNECNVAAATQRQALNGLVSLYDSFAQSLGSRAVGAGDGGVDSDIFDEHPHRESRGVRRSALNVGS